MPIDIVKKHKKRHQTVNLKNGTNFNNLKSKQTKKERNLEEKIEKKFSNIPSIAHHQRLKIMWSTVIVCTSLVVITWFYLVSHGVIMRDTSQEDIANQTKTLSSITDEISKKIGQIKTQYSQNTATILNLKNTLETAAAQSTQDNIITTLKEDLESQIDPKDLPPITKIVSESGNLIVTYPLPNYYIDNSIKIIGRGKITNTKLAIRIKDTENKILGQTNSTTENEAIMSTFAVELNYTQPKTDTGILELYTINADKVEQDLISIPINFITNLDKWQTYENEEHNIVFKYPPHWTNQPLNDNNSLLAIQLNDKSKINLTQITTDSIFISFHKNITQLNQLFHTEKNKTDYDELNLQLFLNLNFFAEIKKTEKYINGIKFNHIILNDKFKTNYILTENESGNILSIKTTGLENNDNLPILDQILSTFNFIEPNLENWNEYLDETKEIRFKYPTRVTTSEDFGQIAFRSKDPDDFSFHFFTIEPQIADLPQWVEESIVNLEEKIDKSEITKFGDATEGVYYESTKKTTDEESTLDETNSNLDEQNIKTKKSFGYIFNHYGATYSIRTNKGDFPNTFKTILHSIKFSTSPMDTPGEEELRQEFLKKLLEEEFNN